MSIGALAWVIGMGILLHSFEVSLDVVLEKTTITAGEPVTIDIKYTNHSQAAITVNGAGGGEGFTPLFRIMDAANSVVCEGGQRLKGGMFSMKPLTLRPG